MDHCTIEHSQGSSFALQAAYSLSGRQLKELANQAAVHTDADPWFRAQGLSGGAQQSFQRVSSRREGAQLDTGDR
jgi:hypothetical protein